MADSTGNEKTPVWPAALLTVGIAAAKVLLGSQGGPAPKPADSGPAVVIPGSDDLGAPVSTGRVLPWDGQVDRTVPNFDDLPIVNPDDFPDPGRARDP